MDDEQDKDEAARGAALGGLISKAAASMRHGGEASLEGVRRSVAEVGDRLKSSRASQQVGAAVEFWRAIKKAADAQRRGNHAMAYRLLAPQVEAHPTEPKLVVAFFHAAQACDRAEDAAPYMTRIIRQLASSGRTDRAVELWTELRAEVPSARVDPSSLVRIAENLERSGAHDPLVEALRDATDLDSKALSPGLAVRIAELAAAIDPPTALRALRWALESPDLHQSKRERLEELEGQLVSGAEGELPIELSAHESDPLDSAVDKVLDAVDPVGRFREVKLREAMPTALQAEAIEFQLPGGRSGRVEYEKIEAIAVARVMGLAPYPVVVIDLLLNWNSGDDPTLRAVRLRGDGFDPRMVMDAPDDRAEALACFLKALLARCNAVALPNPDAVLAQQPPRFESLEAYARDLLQVE